MNRRLFTRYSLSLATLPLLPVQLRPSIHSVKRERKGRQLQRGDTVGLITPGSYLSDDGLEKAIKNIESLGLKIKLGQHIRAERGFTAGTDAERLHDLHQMFADDTVAAVWCARGGYGCTRLLPQINYRLLEKHPKLLMGYSDITALLNAIYEETGLIGLHAPVGASDFTEYTVSQLQAVLFADSTGHTIPLSAENLLREEDAYHYRVIRPGVATGKLAGGNLSLVAAMVGTGRNVVRKKRLIFLEDIGEKPYRIDRMLTQLRQAGYFDGATGISLGVFADCEPGENARSLTLAETLQDRLGDLNIPVVYGFPFGHIANQCTLPVGITARLDTKTNTLTLLENATKMI